MPNFVDLIQLGFHGFAFALFFLSFYRFGQISAQEIPDDLEPVKIELRNARTEKLLGTLKWFMAFSVLFFILGVASQIFSGNIQHRVTLIFTPIAETAGRPKVYYENESEPVVGGSSGRFEVTVTNKDDLTIRLEDLIDLTRTSAKTEAKGLTQQALGE
jgi:hypothetical protein